MKTNQTLWKATGLNLCISVLIYACLLGLLWLAELLIPSLQGRLLHFDNVTWVIGIPASVIGVAYILSIKDPQNYTGFYAGVCMSVLLGIQFLLQGGGDSPVYYFDSAALYFCVFIPFQIKSIINWNKPISEEDKNKPFAPEFLSLKGMLISLLVFAAIVVVDYIVATYLLAKVPESLSDRVLVKFFSGLMIASSVLANFWLIYRKNDSWIYWLIYSLAGIGLFIILNNIFSIVLFVFFLIINSMAGIAWIKATPKENYGWLKK